MDDRFLIPGGTLHPIAFMTQTHRQNYLSRLLSQLVSADEAITRSYHEMARKAAYNEVGCGVCKG